MILRLNIYVKMSTTACKFVIGFVFQTYNIVCNMIILQANNNLLITVFEYTQLLHLCSTEWSVCNRQNLYMYVNGEYRTQ